MKSFRADLHIHTCLSPCGSLEMSPGTLVGKALETGLDIIAITDHNSTKQVKTVKKMAENKPLLVIGGAEINSREEVHCLALFETDEALSDFQEYLDQHLIPMKNDPEYFGYQVVVDENDEIVEMEERLLIYPLDTGLLEIEKKVHELNGLFIPAHIDRPFNGIISQLGFVPENLKADAFGLTRKALVKKWKEDSRVPAGAVFLKNSDAHHPSALGQTFTFFEMEQASFQEIRKTLKGENGRRVWVE